MARTARKQRIVIGSPGTEHLNGMVACWPPEWGDLYPQQLVKLAVALNHGKVFAAWVGPGDAPADKGRLIAWVDWDGETFPGTLYLRSVVVHPDFREKGVANRLVAHAVRFASEVGFRQVVFDAFEGGMLPPAVFERLGFKHIGAVQGLFDPDKTTSFYALRPAAAAGQRKPK